MRRHERSRDLTQCRLHGRCALMPSLLLAVTTLALGWVLLPFYDTVLWAIVIGILFAPVYRRLLPQVKQRRNLAAGLVVLLVLVAVVLPLAHITASLARQASGVYQRTASGA